MTLEQALPLLDARAARGTGPARRPPAKRAPAAKKATAAQAQRRRRRQGHARQPRLKPRKPKTPKSKSQGRQSPQVRSRRPKRKTVRKAKAGKCLADPVRISCGPKLPVRGLIRDTISNQHRIPSKDELAAFIGKQPGKVGTREIARAFGLKNADRAALKRMLRELADEGQVERRRKKLHQPGTLPHVVSPTSPSATATAN